MTKPPFMLTNTVKVSRAQKTVSVCHWLTLDEIYLFTLSIAGILQSQAGSEQQYKDSNFD